MAHVQGCGKRTVTGLVSERTEFSQRLPCGTQLSTVCHAVSQSCVQDPTPEPLKGILSGKRGLCRWNQQKAPNMSSSCILGGVLNSMTSILIRGEDAGTKEGHVTLGAEIGRT